MGRQASSFPAARGCARLPKEHLDHAAHTLGLTLPAQRLEPTGRSTPFPPVRQTAGGDPVMLSVVRQGLSDIQGSRGVPRRVTLARCPPITCFSDSQQRTTGPLGVVMNQPVFYSVLGNLCITAYLEWGTGGTACCRVSNITPLGHVLWLRICNNNTQCSHYRSLSQATITGAKKGAAWASRRMSRPSMARCTGKGW
jgi:hypothetical protein